MVLAVMSNSGCLKQTTGNTCTDKLVSSETPAMQAYASTNSITTTAHSSGLLYHIIDPGTGATPTGTSTLYVKYTAKYVSNNTLLEQATTSTNVGMLSGLIAGWQIGIPLIKKGGTIELIIPSSLAYGCSGRNPVPGDAILYFKIELVDVQ
ncbi:MAG TPA: FKBP-type peptidyl-prolyl cis-trans isomerase [Chitinophagaceae bacterium]